MKININTHVTVKLTDLGLDHYVKYVKDLDLPYPTERWMLDRFEISREFTSSLWDIMKIFGPIMYIGMESPFEDNTVDIKDR